MDYSGNGNSLYQIRWRCQKTPERRGEQVAVMLSESIRSFLACSAAWERLPAISLASIPNGSMFAEVHARATSPSQSPFELMVVGYMLVPQIGRDH